MVEVYTKSMRLNISKAVQLTSMADVESFLYGLPSQSQDYSTRLAHVKSVLASLGSPQNATAAIHIAGTSGKGSTAYYASAILNSAGYTTGLIVSPHVHSVKERAQINGRSLADAEYIHYFNQFANQFANQSLTYIEFLTIFAFWLFTQKNVDYMVIEVGLGGLLDPTNVISRPHTVRVITDIGYDHMEILGSTLPAIAAQKAGIIHSSDSVVMHRQSSEITDVIKNTAKQQNASLHEALEHVKLDFSQLALYQQRNWTLAEAAVRDRLSLDDKPPINIPALQKSLSITIPGRFEKRTYSGTELILDVAHNPQKITALASSLRYDAPHQKPVIIVAFARNKQASVKESIKIISSVATLLIFTTFQVDFSSGSHAAIEPNKLTALTDAPHLIEPSLPSALQKAAKIAKQNNTYIVVTGSFYLLDNIYPLLTTDAQKTE